MFNKVNKELKWTKLTQASKIFRSKRNIFLRKTGNQDFVSLSLRYYTTTKVGRVRVTTTGLCDPYFVVTTSLECLTLDVGQTEVVTRDQHTKNGFCVMCMQIYTFLIQRLQILVCLVRDECRMRDMSIIFTEKYIYIYTY